MCGRMKVDDEALDDLYAELLDMPFPGETNHNVAPTEPVWIVRNRSPRSTTPGLEAAEAQWWLTPFWSKTPKPPFATFNAKAETLLKSSTFREPFRHRRCLVPVSGFYEWRREPSAGEREGPAPRKKERQPYYVRPQAGPLLLAGVWDRWRSRDKTQVVDSFAVITTAVSSGLAFLHDRQPVMLDRADAPRWLDRGTAPESLADLLAPRVPLPLVALPVSDYVGNPRNKERRCATPVGKAIEIARA